MASALTQEQLNLALQSLKSDLRSDLSSDLRSELATKEDLVELKSSFSDLQTSVDRYLKFTETWHQELTILKGRQDRLAQVLVNKGVVTEQEIALLA